MDEDLRDAVILAVLDNPDIAEDIAELLDDPEGLQELLADADEPA